MIRRVTEARENIFEAIDEAQRKDNLSSGSYLRLCDCAQGLVSLVYELLDDRDSDTESNNRESPVCFCNSLIDFNDTSTFSCISCSCSINPGDCCNLKLIFERFPLLQNLEKEPEERTAYTYNSTPNLENCIESDIFWKNIRLFLTLTENIFFESRDRCLVIFALFSYLFDHFKFILDNESFRKNFQERIIFLEKDEIYRNLAEEYRVPIKEWKKQLVK